MRTWLYHLALLICLALPGAAIYLHEANPAHTGGILGKYFATVLFWKGLGIYAAATTAAVGVAWLVFRHRGRQLAILGVVGVHLGTVVIPAAPAYVIHRVWEQKTLQARAEERSRLHRRLAERVQLRHWEWISLADDRAMLRLHLVSGAGGWLDLEAASGSLKTDGSFRLLKSPGRRPSAAGGRLTLDALVQISPATHAARDAVRLRLACEDGRILYSSVSPSDKPRLVLTGGQGTLLRPLPPPHRRKATRADRLRARAISRAASQASSARSRRLPVPRPRIVPPRPPRAGKEDMRPGLQEPFPGSPPDETAESAPAAETNPPPEDGGTPAAAK